MCFNERVTTKKGADRSKMARPLHQRLHLSNESCVTVDGLDKDALTTYRSRAGTATERKPTAGVKAATLGSIFREA